jgi:lipopolysaccharide/colanic/teichoic acid biosynthesis glycosyltransferase
MHMEIRNNELSLRQPSSPVMMASAASLPSGRRNVFAHVVKNSIDLIGATVLITLLFPLFALIAALVYFEDGAPIIHRRRVVGQKAEFDAFKFRTMRRDADSLLVRDPVLWAEYQRNFKLANDPRVTRFGALLRKLSIDELPQLFNVLIGQMSLVGPRMITPAELEKYGPYKRLLLSCKPGLTGYWQVFARQTVSYDERVRMDVYYLQNWSLGMDLLLLLRTPLKVLNMKGAF